MKKLSYMVLSFILLITACSGQYDKVPMEQFEGNWELKGRSMFDGIQVHIISEKGKLKGKIVKLNDNKYVQLLAEEGDIWISEIARSSNYQFRITEKKIGRELFSLYGLGSSTEFKAVFIDKNTVGISGEGGDPSESTILYQRIK